MKSNEQPSEEALKKQLEILTQQLEEKKTQASELEAHQKTLLTENKEKKEQLSNLSNAVCEKKSGYSAIKATLSNLKGDSQTFVMVLSQLMEAMSKTSTVDHDEIQSPDVTPERPVKVGKSIFSGTDQTNDDSKNLDPSSVLRTTAT